MNTTETMAIYKKVGRKYVPIHSQWHEDHLTDRMAVGSFRMVYAHKDGCRKYEYDVTPATAPSVAAMMIARAAMEDAINEKSKYRPSGATPYTNRQLALIAQFQRDMGMNYPTHWTQSSSREISESAINAVLEFRP